MHAKFVFPKLRRTNFALFFSFVGHDLNAMSAIMVCSKFVSACDVCVLCLPLEVLCVKCEDSYKIV